MTYITVNSIKLPSLGYVSLQKVSPAKSDSFEVVRGDLDQELER